MKTEFEIKMSTRDMYSFLMYHAYHGFSGVFSIVAGAVLLGYYAYSMTAGVGANRWIYLVFGVLFLVYQPWTLYTGALRQAKLNPVFKQPLHYLLDEEGITAAQGEAVSQIKWDAVVKVRETSARLYVYTGSRNACIWVKSQMGQQEAAAKELLKKYVPAKQRKLKGQENL